MNPAGFPRVRRQTLAEQVAEAVLGYIGSEGFRPGDVLPPESRLATEFGVSRPVIREAMKSLEGKGVTEMINGRGAVVKSTNGEPLRFFFERAVHLEAKTVVELMEVRKGLETQSAALAAERRIAEHVAGLGETIQQMRACMDNAEEYADLDVHFHLQVADAAGNAMLYLLVESIRDALKSSILEGLRTMSSPPDRELAQRLHEKVFEAIEDGHAEKARQAMALHFDEAVMALVQDEAINLARPTSAARTATRQRRRTRT